MPAYACGLKICLLGDDFLKLNLAKFFGAQDMTKGNPYTNLIQFAAPLLVGNLVQQLYGTVDSIVVGKYVGDNALAAVNATMPIVNLLMVLFMALAAKVEAQNIQLHYDVRRNCATSTVEMFRADNYGSTFFFIDMDFAPKAFGAYGEISREFCFWKDSKLNWLSAHIEYNGGLNNTMSFDNAWLVGATYSGHSKDWSKAWSVSAMYKAIPGNESVSNSQITGVWNLDFLDHWLSFNGFADFWREKRAWQGTKFIFIAEPQLWVNMNKIKGMEKVNLSLGTEVELSNNFVAKGFDVMPTVAVKYAF